MLRHLLPLLVVLLLPAAAAAQDPPPVTQYVRATFPVSGVIDIKMTNYQTNGGGGTATFGKTTINITWVRTFNDVGDAVILVNFGGPSAWDVALADATHPVPPGGGAAQLNTNDPPGSLPEQGMWVPTAGP